MPSVEEGVRDPSEHEETGDPDTSLQTIGHRSDVNMTGDEREFPEGFVLIC